MNENIDLKKIEKKAYHINFEDGTYDIMWGILLIGFALAPYIREIIGLGYILIMVIPGPLIFLLTKKYIAVPRIGIAKYGDHRKKKQKTILIITLIVFPISIILPILTYLGPFQINISTNLGGYLVPLSAGLFAIFICGLFAYFLDFSHMFYYGVLIGIGIIAAELLRQTLGPLYNNYLVFGIPGSTSIHRIIFKRSYRRIFGHRGIGCRYGSDCICDFRHTKRCNRPQERKKGDDPILPHCLDGHHFDPFRARLGKRGTRIVTNGDAPEFLCSALHIWYVLGDRGDKLVSHALADGE